MAFTAPHPIVQHRRPRRRTLSEIRRRGPVAALGRVLVVGANRGLGLELSRRLRTHGASHVTGTARAGRDVSDLETAADESLHLDVHDAGAVGDAVARARPDVVVNCIGGDDTGLDSESAIVAGNRHLISASKSHGVGRFVLVSALGAGDSEKEVPMQVYFTMRHVLVDKTMAETHLRQSGLEWTIARPGALVDDADEGVVVATEGDKCYATVTRAGLAEMLIRAAESEKAVGKTLAIVDRSRVLITSPYVRPLEPWEGLPFDEFEL